MALTESEQLFVNSIRLSGQVLSLLDQRIHELHQQYPNIRGKRMDPQFVKERDPYLNQRRLLSIEQLDNKIHLKYTVRQMGLDIEPAGANLQRVLNELSDEDRQKLCQRCPTLAKRAEDLKPRQLIAA
jgi:hypothetical protein